MNYGPASKYYDLFGAKDDVDFYKELAIRQGRKALELGVGTGRVSIELARAGVAVWGLDNSRYMLTVAEGKLKKEKGAVRKRVVLRLGDMRDFRLEDTFPFVYSPSSTFEHCVTTEDQKRCLECAYGALERRGVLAFDLSQLRADQPLSSWWIDRRQLSATREVVRTIFSRRNPSTNVVSLNLFFDVYSEGGLRERYYEYGEARVSSRDEIEALLETVGFKVEQVYGDFDKSSYDQSSLKMIFVASKP